MVFASIGFFFSFGHSLSLSLFVESRWHLLDVAMAYDKRVLSFPTLKVFIGDGLGIVKVVHYFCLLEGKGEGCVFFSAPS